MKQPKDMSNSEINTELALKMGWHKRTDGNWDRWDEIINNREKIVVSCEHWHPTSSLDQCHEIEGNCLNENNCDFYSVQLRHVLMSDAGVSTYELIHATARQKSEALLMTLREVEG